MVRTFHPKLSPLSLLPPLLSAGMALWLLWTPSAARAVMGLVMVVATVVMTERTIHTQYVFDDNRLLTISHGRFARRQTVRLSDVVSVESFPPRLLMPAYVLITHGAGHRVAVCPENSKAFMAELKKRQR